LLAMLSQKKSLVKAFSKGGKLNAKN